MKGTKTYQRPDELLNTESNVLFHNVNKFSKRKPQKYYLKSFLIINI